ncbi:hypothetical protein ACQJBY_045102 [Aegilops geniculata]
MAPPAVVGFADLPTEALDEIARRSGPLDNVLCSAVCRSWRRALRTARLGRLQEPNRPHSIFLRTNAREVVLEVSSIHRRDYYEDPPFGRLRVRTVVDGKIANYPSINIIGASYGWIVAVYKQDDRSVIYLVDPFTGRRFPLPRFTDLSRSWRQEEELRTGLLFKHRGMFHKAALAPGRRLGTYAVMLIHSDGRGLSFLRPGDRSWRTVRSARAMPHRYFDVVFHKGAFCTLSCFGEVNAWAPDGGGGLRTRRLTDQRPEQLEWAVLAESASRHDLLMVSTMDRPQCSKRRQHFEVSRCDERQRRWLPVKDIGETAILAGSQCSLCLSTRGSPRLAGSSNHIYFASDCATSNMKCDYGNPDYYRLPIAAESLAGREISGWTWFLPYVARLDYGASPS